LLPSEAEPDTLAVLKAQARRLFDAMLASADRDDLLTLNPMLAKFNRSR